MLYNKTKTEINVLFYLRHWRNQRMIHAANLGDLVKRGGSNGRKRLWTGGRSPGRAVPA
jgi:hypothetical protein